MQERTKLSVRNLSKSFRIRGGKNKKDHLLPVLRDINFDVCENEVVTLVGESGCGKTTLLRIIQGLVRYDSGSAEADGVPIKGPGRDRGFVFQQASLLPWRTARSNIEFGLELQGVPPKAREQKARELLKLVNLAHAEHQYPHELSGGMQQRVGIARALAIDPSILLMDEPFSALDAQTREVLQKEMLRIQSETRNTVLFVTHDLDEAIYISNRVIALAAKPGRVREIIDIPFPRDRGDISELRGHPEFQRIRAHLWSLIRGDERRAA